MKTTTRSAMSTATENVTVAQTILAQLGGRRFIAMTGARNLLATDTGLQCKLGSGAQNGITHLRIDLDRGLDLYNVTFLRVRGTSVETVSEHTMIEVSMLRDLFTRETGFYTLCMRRSRAVATPWQVASSFRRSGCAS